MSKNEEQFYSVFKEAFADFSPEVPSGIYARIIAGLGRSAFSWKKVSLGLVLISSAAAIIYYSSDQVLTGTSLTRLEAGNGAVVYKSQASIGLEQDEDWVEEEALSVAGNIPQKAIAQRAAVRNTLSQEWGTGQLAPVGHVAVPLIANGETGNSILAVPAVPIEMATEELTPEPRAEITVPVEEKRNIVVPLKVKRTVVIDEKKD